MAYILGSWLVALWGTARGRKTNRNHHGNIMAILTFRRGDGILFQADAGSAAAEEMVANPAFTLVAEPETVIERAEDEPVDDVDVNKPSKVAGRRPRK